MYLKSIEIDSFKDLLYKTRGFISCNLDNINGNIRVPTAGWDWIRLNPCEIF